MEWNWLWNLSRIIQVIFMESYITGMEDVPLGNGFNLNEFQLEDWL